MWDAAQDSRIWEGANGRPAAFAMLWRRRPDSLYLALERFVDPAGVADELVAATLQWATERAQAIAQELGEPLALYACRLATAVHPIDQFDVYGFTALPPDLDAQGLYFARPLAGDISAPPLPPSYLIRPLQNSAELAAYGESYDFTAVDPTTAWKCSTATNTAISSPSPTRGSRSLMTKKGCGASFSWPAFTHRYPLLTAAFRAGSAQPANKTYPCCIFSLYPGTLSKTG